MTSEREKQTEQWPEVVLHRERGQMYPLYVWPPPEVPRGSWEMARYVPLDKVDAANQEAIEAIDGMVAYLAESGLSEEGGGLALYPHIQRVSEARATLAQLGDIAMATDRRLRHPENGHFCGCVGGCMLTKAECSRKRIRCRYKNGEVRPLSRILPPSLRSTQPNPEQSEP